MEMFQLLRRLDEWRAFDDHRFDLRGGGVISTFTVDRVVDLFQYPVGSFGSRRPEEEEEVALIDIS